VDPGIAEAAIEGVDDWQRRGGGGLLAIEPLGCPSGAGLRRLEWFAFESNQAGGALTYDLNDFRRTRIGGGVVRCSAAIC
jgi:hypothetical protein